MTGLRVVAWLDANGLLCETESYAREVNAEPTPLISLPAVVEALENLNRYDLRDLERFIAELRALKESA